MDADLLAGWLVAAVAFGAVPAGSLLLLLMMRLIPGIWSRQLRLSAEAGSTLVPAAALAFVPVVSGMAFLYPWVSLAPANAFQRFWLSPIAYFACTFAWFAAQWLLGRRMRRRRAIRTTAVAGVIVLPLLAFLVAAEWLLSFDPEFASSAFGLEFLLALATIAFSALILLRLGLGRVPRSLGVAGGLLLTLALLGAYFEFLPFFIAWSGNLPPNAGWYLAHSANGWSAAIWAFALLGGWPMLALLFATVRRSPRWLSACALSMLAAKLIELGWWVLPGRGSAALLTASVAILGLAILARLMLLHALRARIAARCPTGSTP